MQQDTTSVILNTPVRDSIPVPRETEVSAPDTVPVSTQQVIGKDTIAQSQYMGTAIRTTPIVSSELLVADTSVLETVITTQPNILNFKVHNNFNYTYIFNDSSLYAVKPEALHIKEQENTLTIYREAQKINRRPKNESWLLPVFIVSILIIVWVKIYYQRFLNQVIQTVINYQLSLKLLRERNIIIRRLFTLLNIHFVIIVALFLFFYNQKFGLLIGLDGLKGFGLILAGVFIFNIGRYVLQRIVAYIFDCTPIVKEYLHNVFLINKNIGLLLLPLTIIAVYLGSPVDKYLLLIGLITLIISIIYQFIRGFTLILKKGVLLFYSILYFCTLEILPVILGIKFLISLS